jgi:hypothetical protein
LSISQWLKRFGKKREPESQHAFSTATIVAEGQYVSRQEYEALVERIEPLLVISQNPVPRLEFPVDILERLPLVVKKAMEGVIFNYERDFPDFCFMGMRKALIDAIRIRFLKDEKAGLLYDENGNAYKLERWIDLAREHRYVSRTEANDLKAKVKVFGDTASHDYMVDLHKEEVPQVFTCLRMALSRMYYQEETTEPQN